LPAVEQGILPAPAEAGRLSGSRRDGGATVAWRCRAPVCKPASV